MDGDEAVCGDRDLYRFAYLQVAVPLGERPSPATTTSSFSARFSAHYLQHGAIRPAGATADVGQAQETPAEEPAEVPVIQKRGSPKQTS